MKETTSVFLIIFINVLFLLYGISTLSISYYEADIFFNDRNLIHYIVQASCKLFGQNDYALRLPFIILHVASTVLLYKVGKPHLKRKIDRVSSILIYVLLPGTISAALLVNGAGVVIFFTLLFIFLYQEDKKIASYVVLALTILADPGFMVLYFLLFFFATAKRELPLMMVSLALFSFAAYFYGFNISGKPKGYFLDTFGIYTAIFSPFLFLYFIYTMYRILIKKQKTLLWWISFGAFVFSLLLSFRQRIPIEDFAPYAVIATPLIVRTFFNSYRVRLPEHRKIHKIVLGVTLAVLIINSSLAIFNHAMYGFYANKTKHFAYPYHVVKELAYALHVKGVNRLHVEDERLALRLKFYGIEDGLEFKLSRVKNGDITIKYFNTVVDSFSILKF
ncbi:MAG: glycosyltransferase family 39 protein [Campylobacteraceae bacterium]